MIPTLTQEERDKFATWLEYQAKADHKMAEQIKDMRGPPSMAEVLAKKYRVEAMAKEIVAKVLRSIETETMIR